MKTHWLIALTLVVMHLITPEVTAQKAITSKVVRAASRSIFYGDPARACHLLYKKRTARPRRPLFALRHRSAGHRPMAETDTPRRKYRN